MKWVLLVGFVSPWGPVAGSQAQDGEDLRPEGPPRRAPEAQERTGRFLHLVLWAHRFESREAFLAEVEFLIGRLRAVEPWRSSGGILFHPVFSDDSDVAYVQTENVRHPQLRIRPAINGPLRSLGLDRFKLIMVSRERFLSWANVAQPGENSVVAMSIPRDVPPEERDFAGRVFLHELGHAFGLRDEMTTGVVARAGSLGTRPGPPNCAPDLETARAWWGDLVGTDPRVGFFLGCAGNPTYYRPTATSLMNFADLASAPLDYGPVSERYLRAVLQAHFPGPAPAPDVGPR